MNILYIIRLTTREQLLVIPIFQNMLQKVFDLYSDKNFSFFFAESFYRYINGEQNDSLEAIRTPPEMFRTSSESIHTEYKTGSEYTKISRNDELRNFELSSESTNIEFRSGHESTRTSTNDQLGNSEINSPCKDVKDIGINCTVLTRDIGTMCTVQNLHVATNTPQTFFTNSSTMTDPEVSTVSFNLNQILEPASQKVATVGTQTYSKITSLLIVEKRDQNVQTDTELFNEYKRNLLDNRLFRRSVSTLTDNSRYELEPIIENRRLYSKHSQTKDVIVRERVLCKKVGSQTDLSTTPKFRDAAVNTVRKNVVSVSSGDSVVTATQDWCEKCRQLKMNNTPSSIQQSVSKIPRPKSAQGNTHSNKKKLLMRQDTYVTIPSAELEKLKELQQIELVRYVNVLHLIVTLILKVK